MSETKCAEAGSRLGAGSLDEVLVRLEEALVLLDDLAISPELGAQLDLLIHRTRHEIARERS